MQKHMFRKGQGEVLTTLLLSEIIVVLLVFVSWYMIVEDKQALLKHTDVDQQLTQQALRSLPNVVHVERTDGKPVIILPLGDDS
ncbi:MAG: hypothetical protein AABX72_03565 [Nanoarchaeota archaeon]